ncbi:uncharacterized protein LOC62_03G005197 [Vanrija pseudolonga]|uniref:CxC5 like cysteine cluster associated with KDZ domain-containing protein n=1 Tax=Vanrija pseudolonga TaxID=143232 RepID=A0AAF1BR37_9TREE|nr:hypothetical protein LOC62_03G005197 [Vanrija pseudolonga]
MVICQGCFDNLFACTPFEHEMIPYTVPANGNDFSCDTHHATLSNAMLMAVYMTGNFNTFWNTAAAHLATLTKQLPKTFYTLSGPPSNFDVCETCLLGYVVPLGMQGFFVQQPNAASCDMCPEAPRRRAFHVRMLDAYLQTNFRPFGAFARKIAQYPACPRREPRKNGTWYAISPTCHVCPECWINWASITPLGKTTNIQPIQKSESIICCLWSPRMRNLWLAGDLADFKTFAAHREQVYIKTWLKFKMDLEMNTIKAAQAASMGVNGVILAGSYATAGATQYGNSSIGWYDSSAQASGQQMIKQSNQMWSEVAQGNTGHAALIQLWTTVE